MDAQIGELVQAWKISVDGTIIDQTVRQNAFNYIENFKQNSPNLLDVGFYLAYQKESYELTHFGLQLIMHTIKFRWNDYNEQIKSEIKNRLMGIIINLDTNERNMVRGPAYVKNSMCLVIIELVKREWPQNWPTLINDLFEIATKSNEHKKLIFVIFKYIAEEFIESESSSVSQMPTQRRKDINQYLNQNMKNIFHFYLDALEHSYNLVLADKLDPPTYDLTNSCLDSLSNYINWLNISLIAQRNYSIINICFTFLNNQTLCTNSAKCLSGLANRKGDEEERKPLLGLFSESVLYQLMNIIKMGIEQQVSSSGGEYKDLIKYLVEILSGMSSQLNFLWSSADFKEKPSSLNVYLEAIYQLLFIDNRVYSIEAIQILNILMQNDYIKKDENLQQILLKFSSAITNSYFLFKFNYTSSMMEYFDTEDEFNKFRIKYRNETAKCIRFASNINFEAFFTNSYEWALKIINETNNLQPSDMSGFDSNSFLYLCWDALIILWNNLVQILNRKVSKESLPIQPLKDSLLNLISSSINCKTSNPNYNSFNLSFLSCVLTKSCDVLYDDSITMNKDIMLKAIIDKMVTDFGKFQSESINYSGQQQHLKSYFNLRRQLVSTILNICKSYNKSLVKQFDHFYSKFMELLNLSYSTQIEKSIMIQCMIYLSNEFGSSKLQFNLLEQFLNPIMEFFSSNQSSFTSIDLFVKFLGFDSSPALNQEICMNNRKMVFFYCNCMHGVLNCVKFIPDPELSLMINSKFVPLFEYMLQLVKSLNMIHSSSLRHVINKEYLDMTDSAKQMILGTTFDAFFLSVKIILFSNQNCFLFFSGSQGYEKHAQNQPSSSLSDLIASNNSDNVDRIVMFVYNTYDTLNQTIALYLLKFKNELFLTELNQSSLDFIYRFGDSIFTNFAELPTFRVRSLIRYTLRTCLMCSANFNDKNLLNKNLTILKLNQVLLEYFIPAILTKVNDLNKYYSSLKTSEQLGEPTGRSRTENEAINNQIIEENQFVLLCRDVIDFLRALFTNTHLAAQASDNDNEANENDENNEMMTETNANSSRDSLPNQAHVNLHQINDLAVYLLKSNKIIYQSVLLLLFDGLNWSDSLSCSKLARICLTFFETFPISTITENQQQFSIYLNEQIAEQIFTSTLTSLQLHGEHQEIASLLINLAFCIYDKSPLIFKQQAFNRVLMQISSLNKKLLDDFYNKCVQLHNQQLVSNQVSVLGAGEKAKRDLFKRLIQPIVGKNLGQLYKNEIKIRVLEPLNIKKKLDSSEFSGTGGAEFNICSLFDPNN
jgi:exportin-5